MVTHLGTKVDTGVDPLEIAGWLDVIAQVRLLEENYLSHVVDSPNITEKIGSGALAALAGGGLGSAVFLGLKALNTGPLGWIKALFGLGSGDSRSLVEQTASGVFSVALSALTTKILYDTFISHYKGDKSDAIEKFKEEFSKQDGFSKIIRDKSERLSAEMVKLFHFREMLLLGKISDNVREINAREEFIKRANLQNKSETAINTAIEAYFLRELNKIFNTSFKELYETHAQEINVEKDSVFKKWFHQFFDSTEVRQSSTQQIQLQFMELCRDYLISEKNEPTFFAKYPKITATIGGLLVGSLVLGTLALALGGPVTWGIAAIALVAFAVAVLTIHLSVTHLDPLHYKRSSANREEIQYTADQVDDEFLRLNKEIIERKETSGLNLKEAKDFDRVNHSILGLKDKMVARGTMEGWLRDYAARYRHSKAIEIDLGDQYIELINESEKQTQELITDINQGKDGNLNKFIKDTEEYLKKDENQKTIEEFQLIPKIKEQVIHIAASVAVVPAALIDFYKLPISEGGLGGFESDLTAVNNVAPLLAPKEEKEKAYSNLCHAAKSIFKDKEPLFSGKKWFKGDGELREMLGIPGHQEDLKSSSLTLENIDDYLNNSYEFLFTLNARIKPGSAINPLEQPLVISPPFLIYRTLLLRQLAGLCDPTNYEVSTEVKNKIRLFVKQRFQIDPSTVFEDLLNQTLMMDKEEDPENYVNIDGQKIYLSQLANVAHAIHLNIAYNSVAIKPRTILDFYIRDFLQTKDANQGVLAYGKSEIELNPQGSLEYIRKVDAHIKNTKEFMFQMSNNRTLKVTGIEDCYKLSVSKQVYTTMLRIAKNLEEIKPDEPMAKEKIAFLHQAFVNLDKFSQERCYPLKQDSTIKPIFDLLLVQEPDLSKLPRPAALLRQIETLSDQIQLKTFGNGLFNKPAVPKEETATNAKIDNSTQENKLI